ncbi:MAG: aconitate hydratase [Acidobacteriota bacterium]
MAENLVQKILKAHLVEGDLYSGDEIAIRVDQTLTQDATGTMAYLQFETMGIPRVKTELSVSYVDHNTLQVGFENADDHRYLQTVAARYGIHYSKAGNGICHQVHVERFGVPGKTLLGSDSHTPTGGGIGMIAIGVGGLDVAVAMGGGAFYMPRPRVVKVNLTGRFQPFVSAKDVILKLLSIMTTKGNVGKIVEYAGPALKHLTVPERATITNMGAELGVTTSVFPSDDQTLAFLKAQKREGAWTRLEADPEAAYDQVIEIDLSSLEPMVAQPHSPDNVATVASLKGQKVHQVCVGSCTNSSLRDLAVLAHMLKGRKVHPDVELVVAPGSRQVEMEAANRGYLTAFLQAGARVAESACGFCIGSGHAPGSGEVSVRSNNRNFKGRSGTADAMIFLASPETCAACALTGEFNDPRALGIAPVDVDMPAEFVIDDSMVLVPPADGSSVDVVRGPNIGAPPKTDALPDGLEKSVLLKVGDKITTDHIMPAGQYLKYRSNIPKYAEVVFIGVDPAFAGRAKEKGGGFVVGGDSYGQGSSREHAAICPSFLGVKAVFAKAIERIHRANLVNFGILPLLFLDSADYDRIEQGDSFVIEDIHAALDGDRVFTVKDATKGFSFRAKADVTPRQAAILKDGGLLNHIAKGGK